MVLHVITSLLSSAFKPSLGYVELSFFQSHRIRPGFQVFCIKLVLAGSYPCHTCCQNSLTIASYLSLYVFSGWLHHQAVSQDVLSSLDCKCQLTHLKFMGNWWSAMDLQGAISRLHPSDETTGYCWNNCFIYSSLNFQWAEFKTRVDHTCFPRPVTSFTCDGVSLGSSVVHMLIWSKYILADSVMG